MTETDRQTLWQYHLTPHSFGCIHPLELKIWLQKGAK
jgi:hypothetical protein